MGKSKHEDGVRASLLHHLYRGYRAMLSKIISHDTEHSDDSLKNVLSLAEIFNESYQKWLREEQETLAVVLEKSDKKLAKKWKKECEEQVSLCKRLVPHVYAIRDAKDDEKRDMALDEWIEYGTDFSQAMHNYTRWSESTIMPAMWKKHSDQELFREFGSAFAAFGVENLSQSVQSLWLGQSFTGKVLLLRVLRAGLAESAYANQVKMLEANAKSKESFKAVLDAVQSKKPLRADSRRGLHAKKEKSRRLSLLGNKEKNITVTTTSDNALDLDSTMSRLLATYDHDQVISALKRRTAASKEKLRSKSPFDMRTVDEEVKAKAIQLFNVADKDNSGTIDEVEMRDMLQTLFGNVTEPEANRIYHDMDSDHSGLITYDEFLQGFLNYQWYLGQSVSEVIEQHNTRTSQMEASAAAANASATPESFEWEVPRSELQDLKKIGQGSFGEVFRAKWRGIDVAVKTLFKKSQVEAFQREVAIMARLRHPNVLLFMGATTSDAEHMAMVMEFLDGGSIGDIVKMPQYEPNNLQIVHWARQTTLGLNYLHLSDILHRDLKPDNIMLDANNQVKLVDFGLSCVKERGELVVEKTHIGTPLFMSPEVLKSPTYEEPADIYAFAICVWHFWGLDMLEHDPGFRGVTTLEELTKRVADQHVRPTIDRSCPKELKDLLRMCWHPLPQHRRNCGQILADLERIERSLFESEMMHEE